MLLREMRKGETYETTVSDLKYGAKCGGNGGDNGRQHDLLSRPKNAIN